MSQNEISFNLRLEEGNFVVTAQNAGKIVRQLREDLLKTATAVDKTERHFNSFTGHFKSFMMTVAATRFALMDINDVFLALPKAVLKASGEIERMTKLMSGLSKETDDLKKSQGGVANTKFVFKLAQTAPFEVKALSDAFVKLKIAGLDPTSGSLQTLVDSIARFGGTSEHLHRASIAIQQMTGKGVISMEELRQQLGESMPNAMQAMASGTGMAMGQLVDKISKGTVEAKSALERMFAVLRVENDGAALKMMDSYVGQIEKLKTNWMLLANEIGNSGGFLKEVTNQLKNLNGAFSATELRTFAHTISTGLTTATRGIADFIILVRKYSDEIAFAGKAILAVWGGAKLISIFSGISAAYKAFVAKYVVGIGEIIAAERMKAAASTANVAREIADQRRAIGANAIANATKIKQGAAAAAAELAQNRAKYAQLMVESNAWREREAAADKVAATRKNALGQWVKNVERENQRALAISYAERALAAERMAMQIKAAEAGIVATSTGALGALRANTAAAAAAMGTLGTGAVVTASKMGILRGAIGVLGGPLGIIMTLLTAGTFAWFEWGRSAEEAAGRAADALKRAADGYATLEDAKEIQDKVKALDKEIADKQKKSDDLAGNKFQSAERRGEQRTLSTEIEALKKERDKFSAQINNAFKQGNATAIDETVRIVEKQAQEVITAEKRGAALKANAAHKALEDELKDKKLSAAEHAKKKSAIIREQAVANATAEVNAYRAQLDVVEAEIAKINSGKSKFKKGDAGAQGYDAQAAALGELLRTSSTALAQAQNIGTDPNFVVKSGGEKELSDTERWLQRVKGEIAELNGELDKEGSGTIAKMFSTDMDKIKGMSPETRKSLTDKYKPEIEQLTADVDSSRTLSDVMSSLKTQIEEANTALTGGVGQLQRMRQHLAEITKVSPGNAKIMAGVAEASKQLDDLEAKKSALSFRDVSADLTNATEALTAGLSSDSNETIYARWGKDIQEFTEKIQKAKLSSADANKAYAMLEEYTKARSERMKRDLESPVENLARTWGDVFKNIKAAEVNWANGFVTELEKMLDGGEYSFKQWGLAIAKDIRGIILKDAIAKPLQEAMSGLGNAALKAFAPGSVGTDKEDVFTTMLKGASAGLANFWNSIVGASDITKGLTISMGDTIAKSGAELAAMGTKMTAEQAATASLMSLASAAGMAATGLSGGMGGGGIGGSMFGGLSSALSGGYQLGTGTLGNMWSNMNGFESLDFAGEAAAFIDPFANGGIMSQIGPVSLKKYANGGIANSPQLALFGEGSMNEAYVPLPDGRSIPVSFKGAPTGAGATSNIVTIQINVAKDGSSDSSTSGDGDRETWNRMADRVKGIVREELVTNQRPGGLLYK